jgi:hypothetical protein
VLGSGCIAASSPPKAGGVIEASSHNPGAILDGSLGHLTTRTLDLELHVCHGKLTIKLITAFTLVFVQAHVMAPILRRCSS